jgi:putative spermidine/putrescine transport system permease protein
MKPAPHPALIAVTALVYLFLVGPLVIVIGAALSDTTYLAFPPQGLSVRWFVNAFEVTAFRQALMTSLQVALAGTALSLAVGIPAAYALARHRIELPKALSVLFVLPVLIPEIVFGFALLRGLVVGLGVPILPALVVGHAVLVLPYAVRVVGASLAAFDFAVEEAAISLGSPPLKTFVTIVLPNIRSGVLAAFILAFITSLNDVSVSVFLTGPGISTLPIQILTYVEQFFDPTVASVSVLLMLLTAGVMMIVERTLGLGQVVGR